MIRPRLSVVLRALERALSVLSPAELAKMAAPADVVSAVVALNVAEETAPSMVEATLCCEACDAVEAELAYRAAAGWTPAHALEALRLHVPSLFPAPLAAADVATVAEAIKGALSEMPPLPTLADVYTPVDPRKRKAARKGTARKVRP